MKPFRGTLIAAVTLAIVTLVVWFVRPDAFTGSPVGEPQLFRFEKHELVRVEVARSDGTSIVLVDTDGVWRIEGTDFIAGRSMVNRVKHQIHDLTARATVLEGTDEPELYGLGKNGIQVTLTLRDGRTIAFEAGDPNPTSVSYYIRPEGSLAIYTVKKAAVDYYSLTLDEFRERRFASFDSKDATRIIAKLRLPGAEHTLDLERVGEKQWLLHSPVEMAANHDRARRLLGRVSALKAQRLIPRGELSSYGLNEPRADITVEFDSREPIRLRVGADAESTNRYEELAYMLLDDEDSIYVARRGLLEEFAEDPATLRNRRVMKMTSRDVVAIDGTLRAGEDDDLEGTGSVRYAAEQWVWSDGVPVSGSTPKRVARRIADLEVDAFVEDTPDSLAAYGLDDPRARVVLTNRDGDQRVVRIGGTGEPFIDLDGNPHDRFFVTIEDEVPVYLVHAGVLDVVRDLVRESNRKSVRDHEKAARQERIESVAVETEH